MANPVHIATSTWGLPTLEDFRAENPHLHNHSSRTILEPEEPVFVEPDNSSPD